MMNLEEIAGRIRNPHVCGSNDISHLHDLTIKYPYAQAFSILYLKALSVSNDVRFDDALQEHAYRITDRMRLFELINEKEEALVEVENILPNIVDLTAKSEELDVVLGLELGADDYIAKPFSPKVLFSRVKAVMRRSKEEGDESALSIMTFGDFSLEIERYILKKGEKVITVT